MIFVQNNKFVFLNLAFYLFKFDEEKIAEARISTTDLQRKVLMEQLEVFQIQKNFFAKWDGLLSKVDNLVEIQTKVYEYELKDREKEEVD